MRDEQFGFRPRHCTSLHLVRLIERITRNFGEKTLTGAIVLDVATAFDSFWVDGLLYKLSILNFPSYLVHKSHHTFGVGRLRRHLVVACGLGWHRVV